MKKMVAARMEKKKFSFFFPVLLRGFVLSQLLAGNFDGIQPGRTK